MTKNNHIAIVTSEFNKPITEKLYQGAINQLRTLDYAQELVTSIWVPGAVEIPLTADKLAATGQYAAVIALGAVIQGETDHYDYVCQMVSLGCQQVALKYQLPIIFGILTTQNAELAFARCGGSKGNKGAEAVTTALRMIEILQKIDLCASY